MHKIHHIIEYIFLFYLQWRKKEMKLNNESKQTNKQGVYGCYVYVETKITSKNKNVQGKKQKREMK